jgi:hypothetical protein
MPCPCVTFWISNNNMYKKKKVYIPVVKATKKDISLNQIKKYRKKEI